MIDKLAYFVAVNREQSFRRAAEACGVAQPTLSAGIKQLEQELGVPLIRRSSRVHGLTPEGEKVLAWARRMVDDATSMKQELRTMRTGLSGHIRLAVIPTALALVPALTTACLDRHPGLTFTVLSCTATRVTELLDKLEVEAGITYLNTGTTSRLRAVPLYTERYRLVIHSDSPLATRPSLAWAELAGLTLCLLTPDMQNRRIMDHLMRGAGVEPRAVVESDSQITLLAHVLSGRFATILPEHLAAILAPGPNLARIPITQPDATHQVGLVTPAREPVPLLTAALVAACRTLDLDSSDRT